MSREPLRRVSTTPTRTCPYDTLCTHDRWYCLVSQTTAISGIMTSKCRINASSDTSRVLSHGSRIVFASGEMQPKQTQARVISPVVVIFPVQKRESGRDGYAAVSVPNPQRPGIPPCLSSRSRVAQGVLPGSHPLPASGRARLFAA